ncbi:MAG: hypothetical protein WDO24_22320 [Pseudomonadota bacterium]
MKAGPVIGLDQPQPTLILRTERDRPLIHVVEDAELHRHGFPPRLHGSDGPEPHGLVDRYRNAERLRVSVAHQSVYSIQNIAFYPFDLTHGMIGCCL